MQDSMLDTEIESYIRQNPWPHNTQFQKKKERKIYFTVVVNN